MSERAPRRIQRFEVTAALGQGGMGAVWRARDPSLDRDVAIKLLGAPAAGAPGAARDGDGHDTVDLRGGGDPAIDDLAHEARLMARLAHPNVVSVYETGVDGGRVYVVMELVDGTDLRRWLATPHPTAAIFDAFAQAGRGLQAAHDQGIIHRDFKPDNVLVGRDGRVRVADFGLSGVTRPSGGLVRVDDGRGTPRYMAPELQRGAPATTQSDVFAFCAALDEALGGGDGLGGGGHRISPDLRALIDGGQAADPAARPSLAELVAALAAAAAPRPRRHRRVWLGLVGGTAAVAVVAAALRFASPRSPPRPACPSAETLLAGRWEASTAERLRRHLAAAPGAAARIVARLDQQHAEMAAAQRATCDASRAGELTATQVAARTACVGRRADEMAAVVAATLGGGPDVVRVEDRVQELPRAADCADLAVPPPVADRATLAALYAGWAALDTLDERALIAQVPAVQRAAAAAGDAELELRAALRLGAALRAAEAVEEAEAELQRAYRRALELDAVGPAAAALAERSRVAVLRGDAEAARSLAELALDAAERRDVPPRVRARILGALGLAERERGDHHAAVVTLERGLDVLAATGDRHPSIELGLRVDLVFALVHLEGRVDDAIAMARTAVALATATYGPRDRRRASALNAHAFALRNVDDIAGALVLRREAVALAAAALPSDHPQLVSLHVNLADDLSASGVYEEARTELAAALRQAERAPSLQRRRAMWLGDLGITTFASGRHAEGLELLRRAVEELISQHGRHHPTTLEYRVWLVSFQLERGDVADAERNIAAIDEGYRVRRDANLVRLAVLHGVFSAMAALARGQPRTALTLSRAGLVTARTLGASSGDLIDLHATEGAALVAERRWAEARGPLERALALGAAISDVPERQAEIAIKLAFVERALGQRAAAVARATAARDVLARHPGRIWARRDVAAFFGRPR